MTDRQTTETILEALNAYKGEDLWNDVVFQIPTYDEAATAALDTSGRSDAIALTDGAVLFHRDDTGRWAELSADDVAELRRVRGRDEQE